MIRAQWDDSYGTEYRSSLSKLGHDATYRAGIPILTRLLGLKADSDLMIDCFDGDERLSAQDFRCVLDGQVMGRAFASVYARTICADESNQSKLARIYVGDYFDLSRASGCRILSDDNKLPTVIFTTAVIDINNKNDVELTDQRIEAPTGVSLAEPTLHTPLDPTRATTALNCNNSSAATQLVGNSTPKPSKKVESNDPMYYWAAILFLPESGKCTCVHTGLLSDKLKQNISTMRILRNDDDPINSPDFYDAKGWTMHPIRVNNDAHVFEFVRSGLSQSSVLGNKHSPSYYKIVTFLNCLRHKATSWRLKLDFDDLDCLDNTRLSYTKNYIEEAVRYVNVKNTKKKPYLETFLSEELEAPMIALFSAEHSLSIDVRLSLMAQHEEKLVTKFIRLCAIRCRKPVAILTDKVTMLYCKSS